MEFFKSAKTVRLKGHHNKYLLAAADGEQVYQDRNGSSRNARWTVELVKGSPTVLRLKSCYGRYLTPSREPFLLGITGRKVLQTLPCRLDSSVEWVPAREGSRVRLRTRHGQLLRANSGLPPWRNSITHDSTPHLQSSTQDWVLWNVEMVKLRQRLPEERMNRPTLVANTSPVSTLMPRLSIDEVLGRLDFDIPWEHWSLTRVPYLSRLRHSKIHRDRPKIDIVFVSPYPYYAGACGICVGTTLKDNENESLMGIT